MANNSKINEERLRIQNKLDIIHESRYQLILERNRLLEYRGKLALESFHKSNDTEIQASQDKLNTINEKENELRLEQKKLIKLKK